jgi:DNA repair exonuclease SbcCD ATPase subunit
MKKDELQKILNDLETQIKLANDRLNALEKENSFLRELVHHLASRPAPHPNVISTPNTYSLGCYVCGVGADGKPMGYVCNRNDCPTRVTC